MTHPGCLTLGPATSSAIMRRSRPPSRSVPALLQRAAGCVTLSQQPAFEELLDRHYASATSPPMLQNARKRSSRIRGVDDTNFRELLRLGNAQREASSISKRSHSSRRCNHHGRDVPSGVAAMFSQTLMKSESWGLESALRSSSPNIKANGSCEIGVQVRCRAFPFSSSRTSLGGPPSDRE